MRWCTTPVASCCHCTLVATYRTNLFCWCSLCVWWVVPLYCRLSKPERHSLVRLRLRLQCLELLACQAISSHQIPVLIEQEYLTRSTIQLKLTGVPYAMHGTLYRIGAISCVQHVLH